MLRKDLKPGTLFKYDSFPRGKLMWVPETGKQCPPGALSSHSPDLMDTVIIVSEPAPSAIDPPHYKDLTPEPILVMEGWGLDRNLSNVIKYVARAGKKDPDAVKDLKKARKFLTRAINLAEGRADWAFVD